MVTDAGREARSVALLDEVVVSLSCCVVDRRSALAADCRFPPLLSCSYTFVHVHEYMLHTFCSNMLFSSYAFSSYALLLCFSHMLSTMSLCSQYAPPYLEYPARLLPQICMLLRNALPFLLSTRFFLSCKLLKLEILLYDRLCVITPCIAFLVLSRIPNCPYANAF